MTKFMVIPTSKNLDMYIGADAFLFGIKDLCINFGTTYTLEEIKTYQKKYPTHDIFVSVNKNMRNDDLDHLKEVLLEIETMGVKGIFYYDISVVQMKEELGLKTDLVWHQEHLTTNYATCNYWYEFGAMYTCLSNEITISEIKDICENIDGKAILPVFGYIPMFTSARHVVDNYITQMKLERKEGMHYIKKEGYTYPIVDEKHGTTVYSSFILNSLEELPILEKEDKIDYFLLNSFGIDSDVFENVLSLYKEINEENKKDIIKKFEELKLHTDLGFLYKETIYKVK